VGGWGGKWDMGPLHSLELSGKVPGVMRMRKPRLSVVDRGISAGEGEERGMRGW
jgi:hypothetical protein